MTSSTAAARLTNRQVTDAIKMETGCTLRGMGCIDTHPDSGFIIPSMYEFDHIDPATKYTTRSGAKVNPSDLIKGNRYSLATVLAEVAKCRVVCVVCHRTRTNEQRTR